MERASLYDLHARSTEILAQLVRYYDSLIFSNFSKTNPHEFTILSSVLEGLKKLVEEAKTALPDQEETPEFLIEYFSHFSKIAGQVKIVNQIYKDNPLQNYSRERTFSQTAIQNIEKQRTITLAMTKEYREYVKGILKMVQEKILTKMIEGKSALKFEDIVERFRKERWIVNLFTLCAQHFWSDETAKIVADMRYERIKTEVPEKQSVSQLTWQRLSVPLVPANLPMPLPLCLEVVGFKVKEGEESATALKRLADVEHCNVIVMKVTTPTHLTYNIWTLISPEYLNRYSLFEKAPMSGVNGKKLQRFKGDLTKVEVEEDSWAIYRGEKPTRYLILETNGLNLFTILGQPQYVSMKMGDDILERLEKGITQDLEENEMYNKQLGSFILKHVKEPFRYNDEEEEALASTFSRKVINSFTHIVTKYFKKSVEEGGPAAYSDVRDWIKNSLMKKFSKIFANFMEVQTNLEHVELQLTFLRGMQTIKGRMSGELLDSLKEFEKNFGKLSAESRAEQLLAAIEKSIKDVVGERSNVFQALIKKKKIIEKFQK
ncbi:hypothetical protein BNJ_00390 [Kaumoebavirus]|uniref:hypothetical protein n=1 Tax=Kaumoebavirus TaxID=1859492 RepID=UPI0009C2D19D|nr:hypothetical protein BNJ_00390 [Kaumoebavirus]ARA72209.1 hypothetical protein BNJ_00390 [Kaumoebavirus]